ncbi:hypothetical protein CYMTET_10481 [Cymbomonas tetramitiformis]|uniref:SET domain-containing protein n=1 Tax=Cymbomonas tetramitiformis TaxID=36881 RepID=A0AAE0LE53_9CHLO|nr:hypothetical protein CYMTET_10481 [Cymbomonas tetramitiformis]
MLCCCVPKIPPAQTNYRLAGAIACFNYVGLKKRVSQVWIRKSRTRDVTDGQPASLRRSREGNPFRCQGSIDVNPSEPEYIPEFILEGETFLTSESVTAIAPATFYLWKPVLDSGSTIRTGLTAATLLFLSSALLGDVGKMQSSALPLLISIGTGLAALALVIAVLVKELRMEIAPNGDVHVLVGVPPEAPPVDPTTAIEVKDTGDERGRGAFATIKLPARTYIGDYEGELLTRSECSARYGDAVGEYVHIIDENYCIDAAKKAQSQTVFTAGHMNHSRARANVVRKVRRRTQQVSFYTKEQLKVGDELLYDYGQEYWDDKQEEELP